MSTISAIGTHISTIGTSQQSYWTPRTPSNLIATVISATVIDLTWDDAVKASDGLKVYLSIDGGVNYTYNSTIAFGVETKSLTGLTNGLTYTIKLVAYRGSNESLPLTYTIYLSTLLVNLIDSWNFNETSGNAVGVKGNILTNNNNATYVPALFGNGVSLGTANTNKSLSKSGMLGMTYDTSKSIAGWFAVLTEPVASVTFISIMFNTNPGNYIRITYAKLIGLLKIGGRGLVQYATSLTVGQYYHLVITWDQTNNVSLVYINGELVITDVVFTGDYTAKTSELAVGKFDEVNYASTITDNLGIWDKILTPIEISEHYSGKIYPFTERTNTLVFKNIAYCWFNSIKALYNVTANKTWINVVHNDGSGYTQSLVTVNNSTGAITITKLGAIYETDDHNEGSILVLSGSNKLFVAYAGHGTTTIRTRISTNALDESSWEVETVIDPATSLEYTYINAFQSTNGDIYLFYRFTEVVPATVNYWSYIKSTNGGSTWSTQTKIIDKDYCRITQDPDDKDIIHFICTWHPNRGWNNNNVSHVYFDCSDDTIHKSDGTNVTAFIPLTNDNMTIILSVTNPSQAWIEDLYLNSSGSPRALLTYYPDSTETPILKKLYYTEWTGIEWTAPCDIHQSASKDMSGGAEPYYPPLSAFSKVNANIIYASKEVDGICEIFEITRVGSNSFTSVQKTFNSTYDQWRPFTINSSINNVFWLNKISYVTYTNFNEQLKVGTL